MGDLGCYLSKSLYFTKHSSFVWQDLTFCISTYLVELNMKNGNLYFPVFSPHATLGERCGET